MGAWALQLAAWAAVIVDTLAAAPWCEGVGHWGSYLPARVLLVATSRPYALLVKQVTLHTALATAAVALVLLRVDHHTNQCALWALTSALCASYAVTLGPTARVALFWALLQVLCAQRLGGGSWYLCWWPGLLFYATGHYCEFAGLQYAAGACGGLWPSVCWPTDGQVVIPTAGFVGYPTDFDFIRSGLLLALNTFAPFAIAMLLALLLGLPVPALLLHRCWTAACCCACAAMHRRHLMVWGVFAPKLLFELCWLGVQAAIGLPAGWRRFPTQFHADFNSFFRNSS